MCTALLLLSFKKHALVQLPSLFCETTYRKSVVQILFFRKELQNPIVLCLIVNHYAHMCELAISDVWCIMAPAYMIYHLFKRVQLLQVKALGKGLEQALISRQNSFTVDCNLAGNNVLYVGVYGPEIPCDEVRCLI